MPLFNTSRSVEAKIESFFDTVAQGGLVFRSGVRAYIEDDQTAFEKAIVNIDDLEARADTLSQEVETYLYSHSLIPEHRGDVLGLLENTDDICDTCKSCLYQFSIERPDVPADFHQGFLRLAESGYEAVEAVICSGRAFFKDVRAVKDTLFKVHHFEQEADDIGARLKGKIFASDLDLASKIHLRYFVMNVDKVSDQAKGVADRLAIYTIKRMI